LIPELFQLITLQSIVLGLSVFIAIYEKIHAKLFTTIIGIGSASGLFFQDHFLYLISDNSGFLYEYNITDTNNKYPLLQNPSQNILKDKPDFESLSFSRHALYLWLRPTTKKCDDRI
jgi:hypothetical protein